MKATKSKFQISRRGSAAPDADGWVDVDVDDPRTYPPTMRRVLIQRKDGFVFFGQSGTYEIEYLLYPEKPWLQIRNVKRWRVA